MDPCGTPHRKSTEVENMSWIFTWNFLLDRYDLYQSITLHENPNNSIFRSNILWSIVLNAFWRSIKMTPIRRIESKPLDILTAKQDRKKLVEWFYQNPDWNLYKMLCLSKNSMDCSCTILSSTFDVSGGREIGR